MVGKGEGLRGGKRGRVKEEELRSGKRGRVKGWKKG